MRVARATERSDRDRCKSCGQSKDCGQTRVRDFDLESDINVSDKRIIGQLRFKSCVVVTSIVNVVTLHRDNPIYRVN